MNPFYIEVTNARQRMSPRARYDLAYREYRAGRHTWDAGMYTAVGLNHDARSYEYKSVSHSARASMGHKPVEKIKPYVSLWVRQETQDMKSAFLSHAQHEGN